MRVLIIHNSYQRPGGEDAAVHAEARMLESSGHTVIRYFRDNNEISSQSLAQKAASAAGTIWSRESYQTIRDLVRRELPDIAHCHNLFPLISPAAYSACRDEGIPVVQTLHNFRLLCPGATFFRNGRPCEECLGTSGLFSGVLHGCYRGSHVATALVASMLAFHRGLGTWRQNVDLYIAPSEFARRKFVQGGFAGSQIKVKPNFMDVEPGRRIAGDFGVFVGRLAPEKGLPTLLKAWKVAGISRPLRIVGDGPLRHQLERECERLGLSDVHFAGQLDHALAIEMIRSSRFLVFPSECYENCPMAILEAFACGVPVIASRMGAAEEIVQDRRTGRLFEPGKARDLAETLRWAFANPDATESMGREARCAFEDKYAPERNLQALLGIYEQAIARRNLCAVELGGQTAPSY